MKKYIIILALASLLLLAGCGKQIAEEPIKIGVVLPLTGFAAIHGQNEREGIDLAITEINAAGGIQGRAINVIYEDDQSEPKNSVTAVRKLIDVDKADVLIGATWDIHANAIIPVIDAEKIVLLSPSALPDTLTAESEYFFSVHSPVSLNQKVVEEYITQNNIQTIGILVVNNPWGIAHETMFQKAAAARNANVLETRRLQNFDNNDLSTELTLFQSLDIDALFVAINFNDAAVLARKRVELGTDFKLLAHDNLKSSILAGRTPLETAEGATVFSFSEASPDFIERFTQRYNKKPEIYHDTAYDAVYAIKYAIEEADVENINEGLHKIKFTGASGEIYFGDKNYPENKQPLLEVIRNGKFVRV